MAHLYNDVLQAFLEKANARGWGALDFFRTGTAKRIMQAVDAQASMGKIILPSQNDVFRALELTPKESTKVVILGQDPYPTPGDAHGLAFSYIGTRRLPASLKTILKEMAQDLDVAIPQTGDLSAWASQGVLLLNTALTVEAGKAAAHLKFGWHGLADEIIQTLSREETPIVFMLWGNSARKCAEQIDGSRHLILEAGHPSPLNRLRDFAGSKPFSKANEWLAAKGRDPIDWPLP